MRTRTPALAAGLLAVLTVAGVACTSDGGRDSGKPTVVATTSILGDVVENIVGDDAEVEVLMPAGVDPHEFQLSAQQAAQLQEADLIVANGLGFEAGMGDAIDAARDAGVGVLEIAPALDPRPVDEAEDEGVVDPHVFADPRRMARAVTSIEHTLTSEVTALDTREVQHRAQAYRDEILAVDHQIEATLRNIAPEDRVLVTNHDVFTYFADRYDFEIVGAVIPGGTTLAEPSAQELAELGEVIRETGVPAIFTDATSPAALAEALADESGIDVRVVPLYTESLGFPGSGAETYLSMMQTNADAIAAALGGSDEP